MPLCKLQLVKLVGTTTRGSISSCKNQKQCTGNTVQDGYGQCWGNYETRQSKTNRVRANTAAKGIDAFEGNFHFSFIEPFGEPFIFVVLDHSQPKSIGDVWKYRAR